MRKKFTMLLASMFLCVGAWAQTAINASAFSTDDVYRIYNQKSGEDVKAFAPNSGATAGTLITYSEEDASQEWRLIEKDGKYLFFNLSTSKYLQGVYGSNGVGMTSDVNSAVAYTMTTEVDDNDNEASWFIFNHSTAQTNYLFNDGNGKLAGWYNDAGDHKFHLSYVRTLSQEVEMLYTFVYGEETKYTETVTGFVGESYPAYSTKLPFGVVATMPDGTVSADVTEVTINLSLSVPFEYANSYETIEHWYYMNIRDDGPTYLAYDASKEYIPASASSVDTDNKDNYTWAFIGDPFNGFQIVNYAAGNTMVLSAPEAPTGDKNAAQLARMVTKEGAAGNTTWMFYYPTHTNPATNCFYIQHPTAISYAFNRQSYNNANALCYWTGRDTGSAIQLVERPMGAVAELAALVAEIEAMSITSGTNIGDYTEASVTALNNAVTAAKALDDAGTATAEDVATLQAAYDALSINLPEEGKFYTITNQATNRSGKTALTIEANGGLKGVDATAMDGVFQFVNAGDNAFYLYSVERGTYLSTAEGHGTQAQNFALATETSAAKSVALSRLADGVVGITPNGGAMLHVEGWYGYVVGWNETATTEASAWVISEAAYDLSHTLTVGEAGWSTIVLGYNTTIPTAEGFTAYTIASQENGYVRLEEATGVLGANVPVLVNATAGDYEFAYTTEAATVTASGLAGTLYNKNITAEAYVLSKVNDVVGLYKAQLTDGAFLNNANKAYYVPTNGSAAPMFSFERGEGTTSIENAQLTIDNVVIYDLTGRRVEKMEKGIYIVNGKKIIK